MEATLADGSKVRVTLPVETWLAKGTLQRRVEGKSPVVSVVVDPDHMLPDDDRKNNAMTVK